MLISILVAAIGVFGVIVLIPFAWEAAERGIDRENAINAAQNYFTDLQAYGYHRTESWFDDSDPPLTQTNWPSSKGANEPQPSPPPVTQIQAGSNIVAGWPYVIDPVGTAGSPNYGQFPALDFVASTSGPTTSYLPKLNRINLRDADGFPLSLDLARRLSWQHDDLVFRTPAEELGPPRQAYFSLDGIPNVKRQYEGRYTMISVVVPQDDRGLQYRIFTLVGTAGDRQQERIFQLVPAPAAGGGPNRGYQGILLGGGDVGLTESTATAPPLTAPIEEHQIRNGDWIMLINYYRTKDPAEPPTVAPADPFFDDIQLNFYQVLNASKLDPDDRSDLQHSVTLQGPDFDAFRDWNDAVGAPAVPTETTTYAILIPNVLTVYERTLRAEQASLWTNQ